MKDELIVEILSKARIEDLSGTALDAAFTLVLEVCGADCVLFGLIDTERTKRILGVSND